MRHPEDQFSAYLDGELEPAEHQTVKAHLAECPACSEKLSRLLRLDDLLSGASSIEPSAEFSRGVMQRVDQEKQALRMRRMRWTILGLAAAMVLLVLVLRIQHEAVAPSQVKKPKTIVVKPQPEKPPIQKPIVPKASVIAEKHPNKPVVQPPLKEQEEQKENIAVMKPVEPEEMQKDELTSEEVELIANLDELENMDLITNYDQLQNLDIALFTSEEERQE